MPFDADVCFGNIQNYSDFVEQATANNCNATHHGYWNPCTKICLLYEDGYSDEDFRMLWIEPYASVIFGIIYPILVVLTIISSIFVVLILSKRHMRSPTNTVLLYMSMADLFVAVVPFPFLAMYFIFGFKDRWDELQVWWCHMAHYSAGDALPPICHNVAIWLTVLLAAQRLVYIRLPHHANQWCTIKNVNIATAIIVIVAIVGGVWKFVDIADWQVLKIRIYHPESFSDTQSVVPQFSNSTPPFEMQQCIFKKSVVVEWIKEDNFYSSYYWTRVIVFVILPSSLLIVITMLLVLSIREAQARRSRLLESAAQQKDHTTLMLILIVVVFLAVNLPQGLILACFCIQQTFEEITGVFVDPNAMAVAMMIDNMAILFTYPLNFAIYCSMSAQFRNTFSALFTSCRRPSRSRGEFTRLSSPKTVTTSVGGNRSPVEQHDLKNGARNNTLELANSRSKDTESTMVTTPLVNSCDRL